MTYREPATEDLVTRVKEGDPAALGALYDRFARRVYRFCLVRVGNHADAEDLTQRVFLKMIESIGGYRQRGTPFEAWLFRLARNAAIDLLRARRPRESIEALAERASEEPGPGLLVELASDMADVRRAMATLTDEQRDVIAYRFVAQLSSRETAVAMGKREGSVRALQFRALQAIRRVLTSPPVGIFDDASEGAGDAH
jgi:RNA polymerase sigma-70 factor (ECF subfamily)